ncbi:unnamed protein product [Rotaria socialis]|uniref:Uncharacterized protein n=1 Tax=Rotaria socialis TaxID=392032 RepID=A0A821P5N7_9BILA|nr:unnamed protein product [Rotaria socialis]CAF4801336.1 unnamed protein product [Rotaria socialis]
MTMSKILSQLNVKDLFNNVKQFLLDTFKELDLDKAEALKPKSKLLDDFDPSDLLKKCSSLEYDVIAFNDEIRLNPSYKANQWKIWGGIILGGVTVAVVIVLVVVMPAWELAVF